MYKHVIETAWKSLLSTFGEEIEILPQKGGSFKVEAIFRESSQEFGPSFERAKVRSNVPHFKYMPAGRKILVGDLVSIRGVRYRSEEKIPDGHGGYVFELQKIREALCS